MQKRIKVTLYIILILAIIAVVWLMFWNSKPIIGTPENTEIFVEKNDNENINNSETKNFEEDVMKDLELFFNDSNGYENIEWDYWFTNAEFE